MGKANFKFSLAFLAYDENDSRIVLFYRMFSVQICIYIIMSLLSFYFSYRVSRFPLMHGNFRIILVRNSFFIKTRFF
jgi:hypothetical protein